MMKLLGLILAIHFLAACSTSKVIRDSEYKFAQAAFQFADPEKALADFPKKERNGFVTTVEKSWISLWTERNDQKDLLFQAKTLDDRKYTSVRRETEYFFFSESAEGYIPAEHEVVVMHLMSAMFFLKEQQPAKARVEAVRAAYFLQSFFSPEQKHFDDPALRVWLAGIWTALGEWNEAQVDLRRAYELSQEKTLLPFLSDTKSPSELNIIFEGAGPTVTWNFGNPTPEFSQRDARPNYPISFSTLPWFQRHQLRNSTIRDQVMASRYMSQYYGVQFGKGSEKTVGYISSGAVKATGVLIGTAIVAGGIYLLASANSTGSGEAIGPIFGAGALAGSYFWQQGEEISKSFSRSVRDMEDRGKEDLKTYRYVRFLPSWISMTDTLVVTGVAEVITFQSANARTKVNFIQRF
ncbi:MAG: hypothetical protein H7326_03820 [Bdellovibrionaceae bacterium]|nr:hypothetical protein [Pseudobdellovibrionaceae bacterium]